MIKLFDNAHKHLWFVWNWDETDLILLIFIFYIFFICLLQSLVLRSQSHVFQSLSEEAFFDQLTCLGVEEVTVVLRLFE